jgi:hypothetical protein
MTEFDTYQGASTIRLWIENVLKFQCLKFFQIAQSIALRQLNVFVLAHGICPSLGDLEFSRPLILKALQILTDNNLTNVYSRFEQMYYLQLLSPRLHRLLIDNGD